jgi:hypothetical protein
MILPNILISMANVTDSLRRYRDIAATKPYKKTEKGMVGPQVIVAYQNHFVGIGHGTSP